MFSILKILKNLLCWTLFYHNKKLKSVEELNRFRDFINLKTDVDWDTVTYDDDIKFYIEQYKDYINWGILIDSYRICYSDVKLDLSNYSGRSQNERLLTAFLDTYWNYLKPYYKELLSCYYVPSYIIEKYYDDMDDKDYVLEHTEYDYKT